MQKNPQNPEYLKLTQHCKSTIFQFKKKTVRQHFTPTRMAIKKMENNNVGKDVKKLKPLYSASGNVK